MCSKLKIFVCEFITGGGLSAEPLTLSLVNEGKLMRDALLSDLVALDHYEIVTTHDSRMGASDLVRNSIAITEHDFNAVFRQILETVDLVWLIAPESDGILMTLSEWCYEAKVKFLGCGYDATLIGTSKSLCAEALIEANIHTLSTIAGDEWVQDEVFRLAKTIGASAQTRWVAKPEDGAGCDGIQVFDDKLALTAWLKAEDRYLNYLVQPYQTGLHASFSMLCRQGKAWLLSCNQQHIALNAHTFHLSGITVNGMVQYWTRLETLARKIAKMLPDAAGYLGVDVIIDTAVDKIYVIEINPRLTTSYVGLGQATGKNVGELIIECVLNSAFKCPTLQKNKIEIQLN
jgi:predicted ATP-grasp superfamily ATP-dependent carboligase